MMMNAKLGTKLIAGYALVITLLVLSATAYVFLDGRRTRQIDEAIRVTSRKALLTGEVGKSASDMLAASRGTMLGVILQRGQAAEQSRRAFQDAFAQMQRELNDITRLETSRGALDSVSQLSQEVATVGRAYQQMTSAMDAQQFEVAQKTFDETLYPLLTEINKKASALLEDQQQSLARIADTAEADGSISRWLGIIFVLISLGVGAGVLVIVRNAVAKLREFAGEVATGAMQVTHAAEQVCGGSQTLASGASEQAAALEETSASMEEMSSVTHKNEDNSKRTAELVGCTAKAVAAAERTIREMSKSMQEISASGEKITKVVKIIDDIAFQTRILSLNAAVEAARAGSAGAGFAVVAEQVGHLAQECAGAAKETGSMIEDTVTRVRDGAVNLTRAAEAIEEVVQHSASVKQLVDEVYIGSQEQARGIDQVAKAVLQMQETTQRTAATAEESATAGDELKNYAHELSDVVGRMRELVGTGATAVQPAVAKREPAEPRSLKPRASLRPKAAAAGLIPLEDHFQNF